MRDIAAIEKLTELPKFVRLLAEHSGQLVNYQQLGGSIPVSHKTSQRYVALLEQVFLVATACGLTFDQVKPDCSKFGPLLESFVFSEVLKLMTAGLWASRSRRPLR